MHQNCISSHYLGLYMIGHGILPFFIVISEKIHLFKLLLLLMTLGRYISTKKLRRIFKSFVNIWKQFMKKFIRITLIEVSWNFVLKYQDSFTRGRALVWLNSFWVIASLIYPKKISKKISLFGFIRRFRKGKVTSNGLG